MASWDAIPPRKAATTWSSEAPKRHISLIRSSGSTEPLHPKSVRRLKAVVFNREMSSSIPLRKTDCILLIKAKQVPVVQKIHLSLSFVPIKLARKLVIVGSKSVHGSKKDVKSHCTTATANTISIRANNWLPHASLELVWTKTRISVVAI